MIKLRAPWIGALVVLALSIGVWFFAIKPARNDSVRQPLVTKEKLALLLSSAGLSRSLPSEVEMDLGNEKKRVRLQYSIETKLQKAMEDLFDSYRPDFGAFVALDAATGRVISMVSYSKRPMAENLALKASFPSASVFKVVTATAAIGERKISGSTVIPFNGRNHTLYRGQVLGSKITHWTRFITLKEAFAHSINTVFAKIGAFTVGQEGLRQYADRFGFNRHIIADLPMEQGKALIPDDEWGLAESASGFTRENTMSPLQGALIAASVANHGVMMEPFIVNSVSLMDGSPIYVAEPRLAGVTMDAETAVEVRRLMKETVLSGTSRSSFRAFFRGRLSPLVDVGGKTGTLNGNDPQGRYDWFVGYGDSGTTRIAVAALTISEKNWKVRSSYLARRAIETFFASLGPKTVAIK